MLDPKPKGIDSPRLPDQRWQLCPAQPEQVQQIAQATGLLPLLAQVLINRGVETPAKAQTFLDPESLVLPAPLTEFPDLAVSLELLQTAIATQQKIAICGDYDADGMTSTALLLRALRSLGARVDYAIPSRMHEGYGINQRIVEDFHTEGVGIILTVDNGIAAYDPIARARELGLAVIVTDHHDVPSQVPPANAILNPKLIPETSPYRSLAGVGVAYVLAICLAQQLNRTQNLASQLLELFTLGTIADLAPLTGVNRRWVKRGLQLLPRSRFAGVQALIQVAGLSAADKTLKPEAIGFRLGPRINAIGRIGNPQTVIELLTTDDPGLALERAMECEQANQERQQLCAQIEEAAVAWVEQSQINLLDERVLVVVQPEWHHGVIGIVASRLVERYGVPVFIGTYEDAAQTQVRGSARGIPEFDVFAALQYCQEALERFGGHRAAGGFSLAAENLPKLRSRLREFACQHLQPEYLKPLVKVDAAASFEQINWELYEQIDQLHPCGIENPEPTFWTAKVKVLEQRRLGKGATHLKLLLAQGKTSIPAMAWRWGQYYPLPETLDVAYRLRENTWNNQTTLEVELVGIQKPTPAAASAPTSKKKQKVRGLPPPDSTSTEDIQLECPEPPCPGSDQRVPEWFGLESLETLPALQGNLLVYGAQRPYLSISTTPGEIAYDRPLQPCDVLLLWTLPPSWTHLRWLLSLGNPQQVYVRNQIPDLPDPVKLRSRLKFHLAKFPGQPLNLLHLGQQWWVAPCTLVATLRELGYPCQGFPETCSPDQELKRLRRWYLYPADQLAILS